MKFRFLHYGLIALVLSAPADECWAIDHTASPGRLPAPSIQREAYLGEAFSCHPKRWSPLDEVLTCAFQLCPTDLVALESAFDLPAEAGRPEALLRNPLYSLMSLQR